MAWRKRTLINKGALVSRRNYQKQGDKLIINILRVGSLMHVGIHK